MMKTTLTANSLRALSLLTVASLPALGLVAGCKRGDDTDSAPSAVRIVDAVQGGDSLQARIDGVALPGKVLSPSDSAFYAAQPGSYSVQMGTPAQGGAFSPITSAQVDVQNGRRYTAIAYGTASSPETVHVQIFSAPKLDKDARDQAAKSGKAMVAVFDAAPGSDKIDVLVNSIVAFKSVDYGHRSEFIPLAALPYEWSAVPASGGPDQTFGQPTTLQLNSGSVYLVVVEGATTGGDVHMEAFDQ